MKVSIFISVLIISSLAFASDRDDYLDQFKSEELIEQETSQKKQAEEEAALKKKRAQEELEAQKKLFQMVQEMQKRQGQGQTGGQGQATAAAPAAPPVEMSSFLEKPAAMVRVSLKPFRENMTEQQLTDLINKKVQGTFAEKALKKFPKITKFAVKALRDEDALPEASRIVEDKKRLGIYAACNIATIFIGFLLKRRKSRSMISGFLFRVTVLYGLRIGIFVYFFSKEASPLWNLFLKTFFKA